VSREGIFDSSCGNLRVSLSSCVALRSTSYIHVPTVSGCPQDDFSVSCSSSWLIRASMAIMIMLARAAAVVPVRY